MIPIKEKPILFNAEMVRAVLSSNKTQTRRVIKLQPTECGLEFCTDGDFSAWQDPGLILDEYSEDGGSCQRKCPYGLVGDRLYVRETWTGESNGEPLGYILYKADFPLEYRDEDDTDVVLEAKDIKWTPSMHMPRKYSRINLEITDIRVERVQDIDEWDAIKEGLIRDPSNNVSVGLTARQKFIDLWNSINGHRGLGWDDNPWVWVVEFKLLEIDK